MKESTMRFRQLSASRFLGRSWSVLVIGMFAAGVLSVSAASGAGDSAKSVQKFTFYSVATEEQFVNNSDDRQRGKGNNPFGNFKDLTATTKEHGNGPFPGDEALFKFNVYKSGDLKQKAGTATFTCQYNFNRNAFCDAAYQLDGGQLIAAGAFSFDAGSFELAITGGTGKYRSLTGDLEATPGPRHSQRLVITLE
jgi:hypothetical protein